ncbi:TPA: hypothetical protein ACGW3W_002211 [Pseudomonas aeruginosa]
MIDKPPFDDEYIRLHARPGEEWEDARLRLTLQHRRRLAPGPACRACAERIAYMKGLGESTRKHAMALLERVDKTLIVMDRYTYAIEAQAYLKVCRSLKLMSDQELLEMDQKAFNCRRKAELEIQGLLMTRRR